MAEAGCRAIRPASGWACWRRQGRRREIVDKLSRAANEALKSNEVLALMETQGVDPLGGTPAEFARFIDDELKKWAAVVHGGRHQRR